MVKRCSFGVFDSDNRYPDRLIGDVKFVPFPKPKTNLEKCMKWIKLCGRPHDQLNPSKINANRYVCTKHFVNQQWPTKEFPNPLPADQYTPKHKNQRASPSKRRRLMFLSPINTQSESLTDELHGSDKENSDDCDNVCSTPETASQTESPWVDPMDMMILAAENNSLRQNLAKTTLEAIDRQRHVSTSSEDPKICSTSFSIEQIIDNEKLIKYYTGFSKKTFNDIYKFLVPNETIHPMSYVGKGKLKGVNRITLKNQLLLTLCKLRNDFDLMDLGHRFTISQHTAGVIFNSWINYMYLRLGEVAIWPDRETIIDNMPADYKTEFPTTFAILDCTEIKIQKPASLKAQSQTYSDYKSSNTLKSLVAVDPRGSVIYTSMLFSGSMSDKDLFQQCGLKDQLVRLIECGYLKHGDGLMADKGFKIEDCVEEIGLKLNIPPFAVSGTQMSAKDVTMTRKIAKHRVHVERAIRRIKSFKIMTNRFQVVHMSSVNQIWNVCAFLTNFMPLCIKTK